MMKHSTLLHALAGPVALALSLAVPLWAQEHPEHPTEHPTEHPEEAKEEAKGKAPLTIAELAQAVQDYVALDTELKGGVFLVFDSGAKKVLELTLAKVHEDKLASLGGGVYFACADFQSADKHLYDLDMFMEETEEGLEMTEISVHKVDGKPRYNWVEKGGVWKKVALEK